MGSVFPYSISKCLPICFYGRHKELTTDVILTMQSSRPYACQDLPGPQQGAQRQIYLLLGHRSREHHKCFSSEHYSTQAGTSHS